MSTVLAAVTASSGKCDVLRADDCSSVVLDCSPCVVCTAVSVVVLRRLCWVDLILID